MAASGTHCFLITVLLAPVSTKIRCTSFLAILPLITAVNGSSSTKLMCCTFFGQAFAKFPCSLQEKQRRPKLWSNLGLRHGFVPSSVCWFLLCFPLYCWNFPENDLCIIHVTDFFCHLALLDPMATPLLVAPPVSDPWILWQFLEAKHFPPVGVMVDMEMFE